MSRTGLIKMGLASAGVGMAQQAEKANSEAEQRAQAVQGRR